MKGIPPKTEKQIYSYTTYNYNLQPTMSYRRNTRNTIRRTMTLTELQLPGGVVIGKRGSTINYIKSTSGARVNLKDDVVTITGDQKQVLSAKALLKQLATNFRRGIPGFTDRKVVQKKERKPKRPAVRMSTEGWATVGEAKKQEEPKPVASKINAAYSGQFCGLDFSDSESEDDGRSYPKDDGGDYVSTERYGHPAWRNDSVSNEPAIKLTIAEKTRTKEIVMALLDKARQILAEEQASCTDSWADAADVDDAQTAVDELEEELAMFA